MGDGKVDGIQHGRDAAARAGMSMGMGNKQHDMEARTAAAAAQAGWELGAGSWAPGSSHCSRHQTPSLVALYLWKSPSSQVLPCNLERVGVPWQGSADRF
jgi:hypothetical protein